MYVKNDIEVLKILDMDYISQGRKDKSRTMYCSSTKKTSI